MTYVVFQGIVNRLERLQRLEKGEGYTDVDRLKEIIESKESVE